MRPVCVKCEREMACETTGALLVETAGPEREWYKIWHVDIFKCPVCQFEVVTGFANRPVLQRSDPEFEAEVTRHIKSSKRAVYDHEWRKN